MHLGVEVPLAPVLISLLCATAATAQPAQNTSASSETRTLTSTLNAQILADLPLGENIYALLETTQPEVIGDRFNSAGLNAGETARAGGFLGSWSQTRFLIGDIDITDPAGSGAPLLFPELVFWQQINVVNGLMPADLNTPGLGMTFEPRRSGRQWATVAQVSASGGSLAAPASVGAVPAIARLQDWAHGSAIVSGPLKTDRLGLVAGGTWSRASKFDKYPMPAADSSLGSGFAHVVYSPSTESESHTLAWVQRADVPFAYRHLFRSTDSTKDLAIHLQSTWERRTPTGRTWRVLGGLTSRSRTNDLGSVPGLTADRLFDGPIPAIAAATGEAATARWTLGARFAPSAGSVASRHATAFGAQIDGARVRTSDQFSGSIGELVDGAPARVWVFTHPEKESRRHSTTVAAFASDHISLSPALSVEAAIRFESVTARAKGAANGIGWQSVLPDAALRWEFAARRHISLVAGYRRAANQLNLDLLSFGDPAAQTASVVIPSAGFVTLIDRVGPGTGGDAAFSRIATSLKRPTTDEFVVGLEQIRRGWLRLGLIGIARRETNVVAPVDVGVPISSYSTVGIADPGHDFVSAEDDQVLTVYNRLPSSLGRNQYLLTNPDQEAATGYALKMTAEGSTDRIFLLFGATASAGTGAAGNRGYLPIENDQDVTGELFTDPNAATFSRGRLFTDRAFTIKWTTVYRFKGDVRVGAIARYQDGQPFARLVLASGLTQGAELVRAYPNGGNRFTFTGTLDARVQKGFTLGTMRLDAIADFYNLATRSNEVEEYVVTGPRFRTPTATEPSRSVHLGVRMTF